MKILHNQIRNFLLLLVGGFISASSADAHRVDYYVPNCATPGDTVIVDAEISSAPSSTRYRWQFKNPGSSTWNCMGSSTSTTATVSVTINGVSYPVSGFYSTGANNGPKLKIRTTTSNASSLNGVQLRLLMRDNSEPCGGSGPIWGGDDEALSEVRMVTIRIVEPGACNACVDNMLSSSNGFYGGFEASNNFGSNASTDLSGSGNGAGSYRTQNNPYAWDNSFPKIAPYAGNNQMVVKASTTTTQRVWYKTISVIPGQAYNFSAWAARLDASNQPIVQLRTYTTSSSSTTLLSSLNFNTVSAVGDWRQISGTYNVPLGVTSVTFAIYDNENIANEFVLDNICLTKTKDVVEIGDRVWWDANRNGKQDSGETGVAGSTVKLFYDNDGNGVADSTNPTRTDITDANGMYLFQNVIQGKYFITFSLPTGYSGFTTQDAAGVASDLNSDVNAAGQTGTHNFTEDYLLKDAGLVKGINLSGTVWDDANGDVAKASPEIFVSGTNASSNGSRVIGSNVYVHLTNGTTILQTTQVSNTGTYSFSNVPVSTSGLKVVLSTVAGTVGNAVPSNDDLPAYWVSTGEIRGTNNSATQTSNLAVIEVTTATSDITDQAFGIEKLPIPVSANLPSRANPGGLNNVTLVDTSFKNTDLDGTVIAMRMTKFPTNVTSITIRDTTYYTTVPAGACRSVSCKVFPTAGVLIPTNTATGLPTLPIAIDPIDGAVTSNLYFVSIDNASRQGPDTAIVTVPFTVITLSGFVWHDVNGNVAKGVGEVFVSGNGTSVSGSALPGTNLYAYLVDASGKIIQTSTVSSAGAFSFDKAPGSTSGLKVWLNTVQAGAAGTTPPAINGITNWVLTGMIRGTNNTATQNNASYVIDVTTGTTNITDMAFGIELLPTPQPKILPIRANPGGTVNVTNLDTNFKSTDPDGTVNAIRITGFPTFVTSLRVRDTTYYATQAAIPGSCPSGFCKVFPVGGIFIPTTNNIPNLPISIDPVDGNNTVEIPFTARDNANMWSLTNSYVRVPFGTPAPLPVQLVSFTATKNECTAQLTWTTANEENTDHFAVEVSNDGKTYNVAGIVKAAGHSADNKMYTFAYDMKANIDQIFRLKMVDLNTSFSYSSVVKLNCGTNTKADIIVMPNPVVNTVRVTGITGKTTIMILDAQGRQVQVTTTTEAAADMDLSSLTPGMYTMRIEQSNGEVTSKKLVKQ